jgi:hypothetical protein
MAVLRNRSSQPCRRGEGSGRGGPKNSSWTISLQSATHWSQIMMFKVGPAMSFLT